MTDLAEIWNSRARNAQSAANAVLAHHGYASARVNFLADVRSKLSGAPVDVQEYFDESITCLKNNLTRSAIVVAWAGCFDLFCQKLVEVHESDIRSKRNKWVFADFTDLKEGYPEAQIIDVAKEVNFIRNPQRRIFDGWLSQRNQCAHPTVYRPSMNTAIGYVDSLVEEALLLLNK